MVSIKYPIGTLVQWNGLDTHGTLYKTYKDKHMPFVVKSHWISPSENKYAAYPDVGSIGEGYYEDDLMLAEGPW